MKKTVLITALFCVTTYSQRLPDITEWEKHGITASEYHTVIDVGMSWDKVHDILAIGVSIDDYLLKPWAKLEITEKRWWKLRRRGLSDEEIKHRKELKKARGKVFSRGWWETVLGVKEAGREN